MLPSFHTFLKPTRCNSFARIGIAHGDEFRECRSKPHFLSIFCARLVPALSFGLCIALSGCVSAVVDQSQPQTLIASPGSVDLGSVDVGNSTSATVSVVNTNPVPVTVTQLGVTGQSFSVAGQNSLPISIAAAGTHSFIVDFVPAAAGLAIGQLTIGTNASPKAAFISLSGTGMAQAQTQTAPQLTGISCSSASMGGTGTDLCTVTISGPALAPGFRVGLSSNNAAVTVPGASLVQTNKTSAQFTANVIPISTAQAVTLTASAGSVTQTFALGLNMPIPTLSIGVASVAYGNVAVNTPATQTVALNSTGTGPVTISGAIVTGAGFSIVPSTFPVTLNPGKTATLSVQFDPSVQGAAAGQLTVTSNSSTNSTAVVALSGTGAPQLTGLSCSSASMGGTGTDLCTVTISGPALAPGFRVGLSSNNAAVTVPGASLVQTDKTSAQFTANVIPISTAQAVTLTASAGSVTQTFALELNVPIPTLSIGVASVAYGNVAVNTPATQTVTLNSTGTGPVTISGAIVTGAGFSIVPSTFPVTLNPGKTATLSVQFDPSVQGAAAGQLTVTSNSSTNSTAVVALSGTGAPQLTDISCSSSSMMGSGTDLCTVTISGPALASGFRVVVSSNNAAVTVPGASFIHPNATSAQFTASAAPVSTAQAVTLSASAGTVTQTFALQLNAAFPTLSTSAASVTFGNVAVNVPVTQRLKLISSGTATLTISAATITGKGFTLVPTTFPVSLSPGQTVTLGVQFDPAAAGAATGQLAVTSNSSVNGTAVIPLSGTGASSGTFSYAGSPIVSTLVPPNPSKPISADYFGMTIHHTATPFPAFPVSTFRFWDVAPWSSVEPSNGQFDWSHMDTSIAIGQKNGISDYIFTFGSVPAWASTNPSDSCTGGGNPGTCAPPNMAAFDDFAMAVVRRYCGTIKYYETWNEPNSSFYWDGTNSQLLTVAQNLYQIAKDPANCGCTNGVCAPNGGANPNQVLMPSISHVNTANLSWLGSYLATAGPQYPYADIAAFHGYGSATDPEEIVTQVQSLNQTLDTYGLGNLQLWNTEANWGSPSSVDQDEAAWLMRYQVAQAVTGVSRFVWYAYDNCGWGTLWEAPWCANPQMPVGQVTAPGEAYGVIENWLSGANLVNCQMYENGLWSCELQRPGNYSAWMVWSSTGTDISVPIPETSGLTVYRDWQNHMDSLPSELTVGEMPVLFGNLNP